MTVECLNTAEEDICLPNEEWERYFGTEDYRCRPRPLTDCKESTGGHRVLFAEAEATIMEVHDEVEGIVAEARSEMVEASGERWIGGDILHSVPH